ncbi:helix-turn-helix domain-containing protein [Facklamia sp. P9177]|uniref:helix-turn-helix domain-containing protein n=1 Tax=unclassified Facklamia TaxID=2622293 RepID=UPI003D17C915
MELLDTYLSEHNITRYQLAQVSNIRESTWNDVNKKTFAQYTGKQLLAIANMVGKTVGEVADDLLSIELSKDKLNGLRSLLNQHNYRNVKKEIIIKSLLMELDKNDVKVNPFTFNRLEEEKEINLDKVLDNIISSLSTSLDNVKNGNPPFPE